MTTVSVMWLEVKKAGKIQIKQGFIFIKYLDCILIPGKVSGGIVVGEFYDLYIENSTHIFLLRMYWQERVLLGDFFSTLGRN